MLKSHVAYLDKTCLKLVQNCITDCSLEQGVSKHWTFKILGYYRRLLGARGGAVG